MDASRIHGARCVLASWTDHGMWNAMAPPPRTCLMQPLGTRSFLRYKTWLRTGFELARCDLGRSDLTIAEFLPCVEGVIRHVLQGVAWDVAVDARAPTPQPPSSVGISDSPGESETELVLWHSAPYNQHKTKPKVRMQRLRKANASNRNGSERPIAAGSKANRNGGEC